VNQARVGVYSNLKKAVENNVDAPIKKLNQQYSNLVEAASALENRMAVRQRNQLIGLGDIGFAATAGVAAGGPGIAIGFALRKALGTVAAKTRIASKLQAIMNKLDDSDKQLLDDVLPKIEADISEMKPEEVEKFIDFLPILAKMLRAGAVAGTTNQTESTKPTLQI